MRTRKKQLTGRNVATYDGGHVRCTPWRSPGASSSVYAGGKVPRAFSFPPQVMQQLRDQMAAGNLKDASFDQWRKDADKALQQTPLSVMDKGITPPSGDKHDYLSLAPYWWPDPAKPNGLPCIRRVMALNLSDCCLLPDRIARNSDTACSLQILQS